MTITIVYVVRRNPIRTRHFEGNLKSFTKHFYLNLIGGNMTTAIVILAVFLILWLILKPFILLIIEKENEKYDDTNKET